MKKEKRKTKKYQKNEIFLEKLTNTNNEIKIIKSFSTKINDRLEIEDEKFSRILIFSINGNYLFKSF